ncbi:Ribonuclease P protein subunit p21 [Dissophora globulifera]|uniref:Ribonuclease P protein subunit p21 n=1 Tax=Dissophora globulifera TaxID=979702 RepID=A0A9P6RTL0_9FUNG|nr:Ribonuclease P protein subunit p21 [Dissophora globulifera]
MAKKDKKSEGAVQNREIFQRMNFLYQAAMCMATITTPRSPTVHTSSKTVTITTAPNTVTTDTEHAEATHVGESAIKEREAPVGTSVVNAVSTTSFDATSTAAPSTVTERRRPRRLSRREKRERLRIHKNKIAMEQISPDKAHHTLSAPGSDSSGHGAHLLSGTARFYASTLREVGRKNVIRIGPLIKRSICQRCEAILVPSVSCEVRIHPIPQLHTRVTCTACGAFRRYFCMAGKGIDDDRRQEGTGDTTASTGAASGHSGEVTTAALETYDRKA